MVTPTGTLLRKSANNLLEAALNLGYVAGQLARVKKGDLIGIEYGNKTACLGEYEGIELDRDGFKIQLEKHASLEMASDESGYNLRRGAFVSHTFPALLPSVPRGGTRQFRVPRMFLSAEIFTGSDVKKLLQRYGYSIQDYNELWLRARV